MKTKSSPILLNHRADRFLKKTALIFAFIPPLADALVLFPLIQIVLANTGAGALYQILSALSQIVNLSGYFAVIALAVYCVFADALSALGRVIALQGISYLFSTVLLRTLMQWFLAFLDSKLILSFSFSNFTLNMLTQSDNMMLIWNAVQLFINIVLLMVLLVIVVAIALLLRRKQKSALSIETLADDNGEVHPRFSLIFRISTLIYLIQALANQLFTTFDTIEGSDASEIIANLGTVVAPYFLLAIYAFIGYWVMQIVVRKVAAKTLAYCL